MTSSLSSSSRKRKNLIVEENAYQQNIFDNEKTNLNKHQNKMDRLDSYKSYRPKQSHPFCKYFISILSILSGIACLTGFIITSIKFDTNSFLNKNCPQNNTEDYILCYVRGIIMEGRHTYWTQYVLVSLLLTYASVLFHMIIETTRTNVTGLLGQMIIQIICITFGIGTAYPLLFLPSYIYFYRNQNNLKKSSVPLDRILLGLIYIILIIIIPTYLVYFKSKAELLMSIISIILNVSPIGFALISLPFRFLSQSIQRCWVINSHKLIISCQIILFCLSAPLFFAVFIGVIRHLSYNLFELSYVTKIPNTIINSIAIIWSVDYTSLLFTLILFIIINEYLFINNHVIRKRSAIVLKIIGLIIFLIIFFITPCLLFPLYIAWKEYQCYKYS